MMLRIVCQLDHCWRHLILCLVLLFVCLPGVHSGKSLPALAQEASPVQIDVDAGYDNYYRVNDWFPITVLIQNSGPDIRGTLEWQFPGQDNGNSFEREIDLPQGAQKRVILHAYTNTFARTGRLRFVPEQSQAALATERVQLTPVEPQQFFVGVLSSDGALLSSLSAMPLRLSANAVVAHLSPDLLPEDAIALSAINVLFVHDITTADLRPAQREALELWVRLGGQLVVGGGANAERTTPGLADLLPVEVLPLQSGVSADSLPALAGRNREDTLPAHIPAYPYPIPTAPRWADRTEVEPLPISITASGVRLKPDARSLDDQQLLTTHSVGDGQVIFAAFDLGALRAWSGEPLLWARVLHETSRFTPAIWQRQDGRNILRDILQLPELRLPSFGVLVLFIGLYIFIIGPLNYIILRRIGRTELAWVTIPAIVVLFVAGTYSVNLLVRGNQSQILQVAVVQAFEGYEYGQLTAFGGVFSPDRRTYTVSFAPESLVSTNQQFSGLSDSSIRLVWTESATDARDVLIDVSSLRTLTIEQTVAVSHQVSSDLRQTARQITGSIQNVGSLPLVDALVVSGTSAHEIGTLAPGDTSSVALNSSVDNFPRLIDLTPMGEFNREQMLTTLFGPLPFVAVGPSNPAGWGMIDTNGVYLLAWQATAPLETHLNGTQRNQEGLTLYIIRLDTGTLAE